MAARQYISPSGHAHDHAQMDRQHTHTRLTALFLGQPGWASTRQVKPIWILLKKEKVSGSGISWATCKSASRSRQTTTPAPHHSSFLQAGCPSCCPTNSIKALKANRQPKNNASNQIYRVGGGIKLWKMRNSCKWSRTCSASWTVRSVSVPACRWCEWCDRWSQAAPRRLSLALLTPRAPAVCENQPCQLSLQPAAVHNSQIQCCDKINSFFHQIV